MLLIKSLMIVSEMGAKVLMLAHRAQKKLASVLRLLFKSTQQRHGLKKIRRGKKLQFFDRQRRSWLLKMSIMPS